MAARLREAVRTAVRPLVFGMIHLRALPGTPMHRHPLQEIFRIARAEAEIYRDANIDGIIVENMYDIPYVQASAVGPEITASMTRICAELFYMFKNSNPRPLLGVQVLAGANQEALAIAHTTGFDFIRAEGFVFTHVADEGLMNACAGQLLRYRKTIGADGVGILADIKKKHCSHSITADLSLVDIAEAAEFFLADGLVVTGSATGRPANPADLSVVKSHSKLPVMVGSGVTFNNVEEFADADALIVGSHFKDNGQWDGELDSKKVTAFMNKVKALRR
uniref:Uncharacterized protein n=1 Tax=Plectus sambesii TaxID=2011161 RepID=A0A914VY55_9BILA